MLTWVVVVAYVAAVWLAVAIPAAIAVGRFIAIGQASDPDLEVELQRAQGYRL